MSRNSYDWLALCWYEVVYTRYGLSASGSAYLGLLYWRYRMIDASNMAFQRALSSRLERLQVYDYYSHRLVEEYLESGNGPAEDAIEYATRALQLAQHENDRSIEICCLIKIAACKARQNPDEAERLYHSALTIDPDYFPAHFGLGLVCTMRGDHQAAMDRFRRSVLLCPSDADAHYELGNALYAGKEWSESLRQFQAALKCCYEKPANALGAVAACFYQLGNIPQAKQFASRAIRLDEHCGCARDVLRAIEEDGHSER